MIGGCVADKNLVNSLTDPVVGGLSHVVTPQGALLVPKPGEPCPAGTTALSFASNALPKVFASAPSKPATLGAGKAEVAGAMLDAGDYVVNATAVITNTGTSMADETVKCVLVGADGKTIPGTTVSATTPAGTSDSKLTLPITAVVSDLPVGEVSLQCKNVTSAVSPPAARAGARAGLARAAQYLPPVTTQECIAKGGHQESYITPTSGLEDRN